MFRVLTSLAVFVVSMFVMTIFFTWTWDAFINGKIYDCTDAGSLDYLFVGDGVHHPVAVQHVVSGCSMSEPDTIKQGWSIIGLWCLWFSFVTVSVVASVLVSRLGWIPRTRRIFGSHCVA
jgi:hypothetical protein